MPERLSVIDIDGQVITHMSAERLPTLGWVGPYEVRVTAPPREFVVLCPPELRKPCCWTFTVVRMVDGALHFADEDVELDPYHMCLLHQLIQEKRLDGTLDE